jgi:hypothetical protein
MPIARPLKLLRTLILRPLRCDLLRTVLTILSVALGVAARLNPMDVVHEE